MQVSERTGDAIIARGAACTVHYDEPINRSTDQPTNRPTDQPTNRPTDQQNNERNNERTLTCWRRAPCDSPSKMKRQSHVKQLQPHASQQKLHMNT